MKKTKFCFECDTEFSVSFKGNEPVQFCPFCSASLDADEEAFDDDSED